MSGSVQPINLLVASGAKWAYEVHQPSMACQSCRLQIESSINTVHRHGHLTQDHDVFRSGSYKMLVADMYQKPFCPEVSDIFVPYNCSAVIDIMSSNYTSNPHLRQGRVSHVVSNTELQPRNHTGVLVISSPSHNPQHSTLPGGRHPSVGRSVGGRSVIRYSRSEAQN